jgi:membrane protease YdiL (CAAX protease family)
LAPIALSALLFAAMHGRGASNHDTRYLFSQLLIYAIATGLTPVFGIGWLRFRAGATAMDLGWNVSKLKQDIGLGLLCSVVLVPPILLLQNVLLHVLPKSAAPDPIPLFLFAVAWGFLYYCTHRIVPAIIAHASLNATSLALFFLLASSSR